jgi:diaminohydroxyphosphoribosylaminopyrimidine deaminase/5-amino-6-(5-phosphoribosylamino)uracil reductase
MWSASDFQHMSRAIQLARRGLYSTDPNPRVGCVIVKDDVVLSEGWHQKAGQGHAEIEALNNAKQNNTTDNVSGATCYITLEPCAHQGRTPPCTESLIEAGIKKVIAASIDPNPRVAGKGLQQLKEAGIESVSGLMEAQAVELNPGFEMRMKQGRPFVRCKLAMSLDGKTALHNGESKWISSPESRMDVQKLRARSSAIMTGIGTVIADDPSMNVRLSESSEWARHGRQPLRVILDSDLEISSEAKILNISGDVIIFHQSDNKDRVEKLENKGAELVTVEEARGSAFLKQVLNYLATEKEINEILLETGSTLAGEMLQAGFIDELIIYIAPALLGQDAKSLFQLPMIEDMTDRISLDISDVRSIGKDIRIKATVNR